MSGGEPAQGRVAIARLVPPRRCLGSTMSVNDPHVPDQLPEGPALDKTLPSSIRRGWFSVLSLYGLFRRHIHNFSAFTALQAASYLIPVVTIPFFARTLTIAGMGQIAVAGAVGLAASVLMDYGIILSGTRFAAQHEDDPRALNDYFNATSTLKVLLFLPVIAGIWLASLVVSDVSDHFWVFFWSMVSAAAMCLFPQWLFQGLLVVPAAARILVITRILAAGAALLLVHSPADAFIVPMTQAIGGLVALAAATSFLNRRYGIRLRRSNRSQTKRLLRDNWKLFSATAWGATHTHGSIIIMGALLPATSIGFYSIAQRISQAFVSMFNIAAQTGFPIFVRAYARQAASFAPQVKLYLGMVSAAAAICLLGMFLLRQPIYGFFAGQRSELGLTIFSIWLFASFFTVISVSLNPIMVALHLDSRMASVYRVTGIGFLILAPITSFYLGAIGIALATLFPECFMAIYCLIVVNRTMRPAEGL
jgi:PST family polysaccharide transporter